MNKLLKKISLGLCTVTLLGMFNPIKAEAYEADDIFYVDSWSGFQRDKNNLPADAFVGSSIDISGEPTDDIYYSYGTGTLGTVIAAINEAHGYECEDKYHQGYPEATMECAFQMMMDGWLPADCYYMMFDFGYYTEYVDYFKEKGWISPAYELPDTFYTMETKKDYSAPYVSYFFGEYIKITSYTYTHATDCKYVTEYNIRFMRYDTTPVNSFLAGDMRLGLGEYIPKFYLEDNGLLDQPLPYMELLQNWGCNSAKFNAYDYYIANPELQELYGPDPTALYWHYAMSKTN